MRKTKFTWVEWYYTEPNENLYDLAPDELVRYKLFIKEAV